MAKSKKSSPKQDMPNAVKDNLTIYKAAELREKFLALVAADQEISLDLHDIEEWDVSGLQLLISLQKTAAKSGKTFCLEQPPEALFETFDAIGLSRKNFQ